jgi:hypothetical protein
VYSTDGTDLHAVVPESISGERLVTCRSAVVLFQLASRSFWNLSESKLWSELAARTSAPLLRFTTAAPCHLINRAAPCLHQLAWTRRIALTR